MSDGIEISTTDVDDAVDLPWGDDPIGWASRHQRAAVTP